MADVALALLEVAVKKLYTVYKNHKDSKRELQEVENFLVDLGANSPILNAKIGRLNHVKNPLRGKLESASKQVEELSSRNSDFLHSDERLRKIQGVRQSVKDAMEEANTRLQVDQLELQVYQLKLQVGSRKRDELLDRKVDELLSRIPRKPAKNAAVPAKHPTPAKLNVQHPKPHPSKLGAQGIAKTSPPRSKSTAVRAVLPSKAPPNAMPRAASASTPRRDKTVELFVQMDSDKQARDVVEKLKALPGVKNAISDQTSKKVSVVPLKGVTLNTDQLLQHARLENKFVAPTLWSKRPR